MEKVLRVGIVGCGEIAQVAHLPLLTELPNFKVTALCDLSQGILDYLGDKYCVKNLYTDFNELVKSPEVDIVLVTNKDHAPVILASMNAGKHVFSEKPMCFNLEEADAIIEAEKRNNVKFMVGVMKRYDPAFQYALPLIKELDDVRLVRVHDYAGDYTINNEIYDEVRNIDVPVAKKEELQNIETGKMIKAIGQEREHLVVAYSTLLYLLMHDAILLQEAFGSPTGVEYADVYNDGTILAVLKFGDDIRCVVEGGLLLKRREWDEVFEVFSDSKRIRIEFPFPYVKNVQTVLKINEQDAADPKANVDKNIHVAYDEAFKREWRHLYDCIINDKETITSSKKARHDINLCIEIIKAVKL